ncbi:peptidase M23 family [Clostridium sp. CAG:1013]|nr:peptidase M23 family [Clostridium sp. CAG:1013]
MNRKFAKRLFTGFVALCVAVMTPLSVSAETVAEIQAEQSRLEAEKQELQDKLDQLRDEEAEKQAYQDTLQEKINVLQEQIDTTRQNIEDLNDSITELTMKLDASEAEIQDTIDEFKERLVALYTAGSVSTLEILLDSDSLSEFTTRTKMLETMTAHDQELVDKLEEYVDSTEAERTERQQQMEEVAELKKDLENQQQELDALYEENAAALEEIQGAEGATENALAANEEELAASEQKMQEAIAAQKAAEEAAQAAQGGGSSSSGSGSSGNISYPSGGGGVEGFNPIWPLPGVTYISAGYNGYPGHKGLDIAGPYGTAVVAAEDGTVIDANSTDPWGMSWGYYVLIYHNGTYSTRYAHLSSVAVSNGQYVTAGTVVGYEGATGNVTGPHLHFEVYQNGVRVDPMQFL